MSVPKKIGNGNRKQESVATSKKSEKSVSKDGKSVCLRREGVLGAER